MRATLTNIPQTVLALRGSNGVGIEAAMAGGWIRPWARPLIFVAIYSSLNRFICGVLAVLYAPLGANLDSVACNFLVNNGKR